MPFRLKKKRNYSSSSSKSWRSINRNKNNLRFKIWFHPISVYRKLYNLCNIFFSRLLLLPLNQVNIYSIEVSQELKRNENNLEIKRNNKEDIEEVKEKYWWLHSATQKKSSILQFLIQINQDFRLARFFNI